jgi:hypothetical protein
MYNNKKLRSVLESTRRLRYKRDIIITQRYGMYAGVSIYIEKGFIATKA